VKLPTAMTATMVSPPSFLLLLCCAAGLAALSPSSFGRLQQGREGEGGTEERAEAAQAKRKDQETSNDTGFKGENLNIQRSKFNYSHVIHPTSESSM
jgi:hypothetical protein